MAGRFKKTIFRQTIIPILAFVVIFVGITTLLISNYMADIFYADRYRLIEMVVNRIVYIADLNNKGLQEFEALNMETSQDLMKRVKINTINSIASFAESFKKNNINILIIEGGKVIFKNTNEKNNSSGFIKNMTDKTLYMDGRAYISYSAPVRQWDWEIYGLSDRKVFMQPVYKIRLIVKSCG